MAFRQRVSAPSSEKLGARFLIVQLQDIIFGIWADAVRGVLTPEDVPADRKVTLLGESYDPTNLARRLGLRESGPTAQSRFVLCSRGQARRLVPVDQVLGLTDILRQDILPLSPLFGGEERVWFRGVFLFQDRMALVVNPEWLVHNVETVPPALARVR